MSRSPDIEDVQEPFCGSRMKNMVPLCDYDETVAAEWFYKKNCGWGPEHFSTDPASKPGGSASIVCEITSPS